jgi:hypothetical protein
MKERSIDTPATLRFVTAGSARTDPARAKSVSVAVAPASQGGPRSDPRGGWRESSDSSVTYCRGTAAGGQSGEWIVIVRCILDRSGGQNDATTPGRPKRRPTA